MKAPASIARRISICLVAVCATLLTASCATGQKAATANEVPAIDGTGGSVGSMSLHAVAIKSPTNACFLPGSDAQLTFVVVNSGRGTDTLSNVASPRFKSATVASNADDAAAYLQAEPGAGTCAPVPSGSPTPAGAPAGPSQPLPSAAGPQTVGAGQSLQLGLTGTGTDTSGKPVVLLRGLKGAALFPGESVPVTFSFADAGDLTLTVPVQLSVTPNSASVPAPSGTASIPSGGNTGVPG